MIKNNEQLDKDAFLNLLEKKQAWLIERILNYVRTNGFSKFTPSLKEPWRLAISGFSNMIKMGLENRPQVKNIHSNEDFMSNSLTSFGILEAQRHRARGTSLTMFMSLFKYFKKTFLDFVSISIKKTSVQEYYFKYIDKFFERNELAIIEEWNTNSKRDILYELEENNQALSKEKNKYLTLFESIPNPVFFFNSKNEIEDLNFRAASVFSNAKSPGETHYSGLIGKTCPDWMKMELEYFRKGNDKKFLFGKEILLKGRRKCYFEIRLNKLLDVNKESQGIIAVLNDVTNLKKAKKILDKFNQKLQKKVEERTEELNESLKKQELYMEQILRSSQFKSKFMASMSHELRTPLNAINGFSTLLLDGAYGNLNDEQLDFIVDIKDSSEHLLDMINKILDISKIEAGNKDLNIKSINLHHLVKQIISNLKPIYSKKNLYFRAGGFSDNIEIKADPIKLKEILYNLFSNAIKYTKTGGVVVTFKDKLNTWVITVKDTGIGIKRKDYDLVFKEFKRVNSPYVSNTPGTGLGLSLTKRLVEMHDGDISFTSEVGEGTTFILSLPKK